ncbi:unnamed protein product [Lupinus luteus]|uniref:Uncharacterized protein n=1 Tax=Lupinus luteus TaxID=3873 RepID=A0AAV1XK73_LUPLU
MGFLLEAEKRGDVAGVVEEKENGDNSDKLSLPCTHRLNHKKIDDPNEDNTLDKRRKHYEYRAKNMLAQKEWYMSIFHITVWTNKLRGKIPLQERKVSLT